MTIGEKITFLRKQKNMSLEDLAKTVTREGTARSV